MQMPTCRARPSFAWGVYFISRSTLLGLFTFEKKKQLRWYNTTKYGDVHEKKNQFLENTRFKTLMINFTLDQREIKVGERSFARAFADAIQPSRKNFKKETCRQQRDHFLSPTPAVSMLFFPLIDLSVLMA